MTSDISNSARWESGSSLSSCTKETQRETGGYDSFYSGELAFSRYPRGWGWDVGQLMEQIVKLKFLHSLDLKKITSQKKLPSTYPTEKFVSLLRDVLSNYLDYVQPEVCTAAAAIYISSDSQRARVGRLHNKYKI